MWAGIGVAVVVSVIWPRVGLCIVSPLMEKNPQRVLATRAPVVLSMTSIAIAAFSVAMFHQMWSAGIAGWPEATLCMALILSSPITAALEKLPAKEIVEFGTHILERFGQGGTRTVGSVFTPHAWKDGDPNAGVM
jgi:hypothetical protein